MKKTVLLFVTLVGLFVTSFANIEHNYISKDGYVPNAETAITIAEAVWLPIYGKGIYGKTPFKARLEKKEIWVVEGSLPEGMLGGVPYIEIQKSDCKILKVTHGK